MAERKIKYGNKVIAVSTVMQGIAEEVVDLCSRLEETKFDASAQMVERHHEGLVERVQVRSELLHRLSKLL